MDGDGGGWGWRDGEGDLIVNPFHPEHWLQLVVSNYVAVIGTCPI